MKSKLIKIAILVNTIIIILFSTIFQKNISIAYSTSQLENPRYGLIGDLQDAARKAESSFLDFDAGKLLKYDTKQDCSGQDYDTTGSDSENCICIEPENHSGGGHQRVKNIIDLYEDGTVKCWTYKANGTTPSCKTTQGSNTKIVRKFAYLAHKAQGETTQYIPDNRGLYKWAMRFCAYLPNRKYFMDTIGLSKEFGYEDISDRYVDSKVRNLWYTEAENSINTKQYRARFIFLLDADSGVRRTN